MHCFVSSSSGSDEDHQSHASKEMSIDDENKRIKRMISNRESARRSRMKRQKHLEDLISEKAELERKLYEDNHKCNDILQRHLVLESENKGLKAKMVKLTQDLNYLHQILDIYKETAEANSNNNNLEVSDFNRSKFMVISSP